MAPSKVNTETMPGDNMSPSAIEAAASSINTVGTKVSAEGATVLTSWQKISAYYHAPEQATLFHAMNPVKTEAEKFGTDVGTVSTALGTFAEEVRTIKAAVVAIRADAKTFLASIANGVEQDTPQVKGETMKITVDWHEDADTVAANNALVDRIDRQQEALWQAERKCANAIYDTIGHVHIEAATEANPGGYGVDHIPDNAGMPWGDKVEKTENCSEGISKGLEHGAGAMASGIGSLFGVSYSSKDGWDASWSTAGNAWKGVGMFAVGVTTLGVGGLALGAIPGPVGTFFRDSQKLVPTAVAGLVAIDLNAKDPLHKWKEKGWEALGESIFNVGTLFVAPTKAGNLGRLGRVGEVAAKAGDTVYLALQASKALKSLAGLTVEGLTKLRGATHFGDALDFHAPEIPSIGREHVSTDVPNTGHNPADAPLARDHSDTHSGSDSGPARDGTSDQVPGHTTHDTSDNTSTHVNEGTGDHTSAGHGGDESATGHGGDESASGHGGDESASGHGGDESATGHGGDENATGHGGDENATGHGGDENPTGHGGDDGRGSGTQDSPRQYEYSNKAEDLRGAPEPDPADLSNVGPAKHHETGTQSHMEARWNEYQDRGGKWDWETWRDGYIRNQGHHARGVAYEQAFFDTRQLSPDEWTRNTSVYQETGVNRNYDVVSLTDQVAYELKSGNSVDVRQLAKDRALVDAGWSVEYVFGKEPTAAVISKLHAAGIDFEVFYGEALLTAGAP